MKNKIKLILISIIIIKLIFILLLFITIIPASALNIIGSGSGGSGSASLDNSSTSFAIQKTGYVAGYRFSYTDYNGNTYDTVDIIDYNNNSWYEYVADAYARKTTTKKYNKRDLVKLYNNGENFSFSMQRATTSTATKDEGQYKLKYSVSSMSTNMKAWKTEENVNRVLKLMNSSYSVSNMKATDKILVEPIVLCEYNGVHYAMTLTEIWTIAGSEYGYSSRAAYGSKNGNTYNWIAYRLNGTFPNNFYVGENTSICSQATALSLPSRGDGTLGPSFSTLITKGYGLHIIFKDDTALPIANVYVKKNDAAWNNDDLIVKIVNSSNTYTLKAGAANIYSLNNVKTGTYDIYATPKSDTDPVDSGVNITIKADGGVATINYYTIATSGDTGFKSTSPTSKTYLKGQKASMTATLNTGYTFLRWSKIKGDSADTDFTKQTSSIVMDSQKEYKAISKIIPYLTVNYYSNYADKSFEGPLNAIGSDKNVIVRTHKFYYTTEYPDGLHNYVSTASATYLGRTYYKATGYWNTKTDGTGISIHMNDGFISGRTLAEALGVNPDSSNPTANVYAQWSPYKFTVNYYSNYADEAFAATLNPVSSSENVLVKTSNFKITTDTSKGLINYTPSTAVYFLNRTYYQGTGYWNTEPDGSGISVHQNTSFANSQKVAEAFGKSIKSGNASVTLYAQWIPITYKIHYHLNNSSEPWLIQSCVSNKTYIYSDLPKVQYSIVDGWYENSDFTGDKYTPGDSFENLTKVNEAIIKIYAKSTIIKEVNYIVNYWLLNPNNSTETKKLKDTETFGPVLIGTTVTVTPTKEYYGYNGKSTEYNNKSISEVKTISDFVIDEENATLNYYYVPQTVMLIYHMNGGNYNGNPNDIIELKDMFETVDMIKPNFNAYEFAGWYLYVTVDGYSGYVGPTSFVITRDTELTATWKVKNGNPDLDIVANPIYGDVIPDSQITVSAVIINNTDEDITGINPAKVTLKVIKEDGTEIFNKSIRDNTVVIPANSKNLIYFNVDIPEDVIENEQLKFTWDIER